MVQTDDGIVGSIFGLTEIDCEKDRGKALTPENKPAAQAAGADPSR